MNREIYEKNLESIKQNIPALYQVCSDEQEILQAEQTAFVAKSFNNDTIIGTTINGRQWYFNSRYDSVKAVDIWWAGVEKINYKSIVTFCGIANGQYLSKLLENLDKENKVIVYEPDKNIFLSLIANIDITNIIEDKRVYLFVEGLNMQHFRNCFKMIYNFEYIKLSVVLVSPGYGNVYTESLQRFIDDCQKEVLQKYSEKNTMEDLGGEICDNILMNLWAMGKASTINILKEYMDSKNVNRSVIPAIIVSAGPSLDKNVEDLKEAKGRAFIVATDSAVRKMLQHDVTPDVIVTVDSHKPMVLFEDENVKRIPLVVCGQSRHEVLSDHTGKMYVFAGDMFSYRLFMQIGVPIEGMQTGGSVANNAFSFVQYLGFKNIILVGQDLAFTDNRKHASNVYQEKNLGEDKENSYTYVEGQNGEKLLTYANFKVYKDWFEGVINDNKDLNVINATQGGALIKGAKHISLKDAVSRYCIGAFDQSIVREAPDIFDDEGLENFYNYLNGLAGRCLELDDIFDEGISHYENLKKLITDRKINTPEFQEENAKIEQIISIDKTELIMELVSLYSKKEEMQILNSMYTEDEGIEGVLSVADHGQNILKVYKKSLKRISDKIDVLIKYEAAKDVYVISEYDIAM